MRLYETYAEIDRLWETVEGVLTGEITEGPDGQPITPDAALDLLEATLRQIEDERDVKALNIACLIKNFRADAEAIKAEKQRLAKRQQATERAVERLVHYLGDFIEPGIKLKNGRAAIGWRRSESVVLSVDPDDLPEAYVRIKREADLQRIKIDLKAGDDVPGAVLEERQNIQIR